ncbi:hypothetical protein C0J52_11200 [Blattella germanica]|nr:hypothetical protein C0J52_11200 [Blattella germanica]
MFQLSQIRSLIQEMGHTPSHLPISNSSFISIVLLEISIVNLVVLEVTFAYNQRGTFFKNRARIEPYLIRKFSNQLAVNRKPEIPSTGN